MSLLAPPVSIVMATYNGGRFLEQQLESIFAQTLKPAKVLVCDDRSEDDTAVILENYAKKGVLQYEVNECRLGVIENFKKAVSLASEGHYIALADQDDIWLPEKLERSAERLLRIDEEAKPALIYSDLEVIDENSQMISPSFWMELGHNGYRHCLRTLLFGNYITGCTVMMNQTMRRYFQDMPSDVPMHDAWIGLIAHTFGSVAALDGKYIQYRRHGRNAAYSAGHRRKNKLERGLDLIRSVVNNDDGFLSEQFRLVGDFKRIYDDKLTDEQRELIDGFLNLQGKSFLERKRGFWKAVERSRG